MSTNGSLLLGSIGTTGYETVTYELDRKTTEARTSPAAMVQLLNGAGDDDLTLTSALIAATPKAREINEAPLTEAFEAANIDYEFVDIGLVQEQSDINAILRTLTDTLQSERFEETSLVLDISHSFRTLPIVFFATAMQLEALEDDLKLDGIFYSRHAGDAEHDPINVIDLTYMQTMVQWYDAIETRQSLGLLKPVSDLLNTRRAELYETEKMSETEREDFGRFAGLINSTQQNLDAGLPLEAGRNAKAAYEQLSELDSESFIGPEGLILDPLEELLKEIKTDQSIDSKEEYELDEAELKREAAIVRYYTEHGRLWMALECARELFINRLLYDANESEWLDYDTRDQIIQNFMPDTSESRSSNELTPETLWLKLSQGRNEYAHAGFTEDAMMSDAKVKRTLEQLCDEVSNNEFWTSSN